MLLTTNPASAAGDAGCGRRADARGWPTDPRRAGHIRKVRQVRQVRQVQFTLLGIGPADESNQFRQIGQGFDTTAIERVERPRSFAS